MPFLRLRPRPFSILDRPMKAHSLKTASTRLYATQGYGDGKGDPKAENPQDQGASNSTKHNAEHPGPAPPSAGKGTGGGPTKANADPNPNSNTNTKNPEDASAQSGASPTGGEVGGREKKARPMIHDKSTPDAGDRKAEVEEHNREFEKGHDRAPRAEPDKVDKKFWAG